MRVEVDFQQGFGNLEVRCPKTLRNIHFYQQNGTCAYCGEQMNRRRQYKNERSCTLEHVIPRALGGTDCFAHTVAVCHSCNQGRGSYPLSFEHIVGILLVKGLDGLYPVSVNLWSYYREALTLRFGATLCVFGGFLP